MACEKNWLSDQNKMVDDTSPYICQKSTLRGSEKSQKPRWWPETNSAQIDQETAEEKVYRNTKCDDTSSG